VQRLTTTVVAIVGPDAEDALESVSGSLNVRAIAPTGDPIATWQQVRRTRRPFCLIADDPLAEVAQAWAAMFADRQATGRLEVAVQQVRQAVRAQTLDLPDFYVVTGEALADRPDFHLAALQPIAPSRVVPAGQALGRTISRLRAGRWWPSIETVTTDLDHRLPDVFTAPDASGPAGGQLLRDR
jgi:predicted NBD/HSP70 family sugar kinase